MSFHYIVPSKETVDEVMGKATVAGGDAVKEATGTQWGYFGYFSDPGRLPLEGGGELLTMAEPEWLAERYPLSLEFGPPLDLGIGRFIQCE